MLLRAHWVEIAESGGGFVDPLCGSATLPIEAALLAARYNKDKVTMEEMEEAKDKIILGPEKKSKLV